MKTIKTIITILIFQLCILLQNALSQYRNREWSSVQKITETNAHDQHPSFGNRNDVGYFTVEFAYKTVLAFDRTDSIGTNICVLNVDNKGWSQNVQYITRGNGKNEFPSLALGYSNAILVYQSKQGNGHNIFYSIFDSNGWSAPSAITNDTGQENLYPHVALNNDGKAPYAVVWERNGKICYREYDGSLWSEIVNVTLNDSQYNSNPICLIGKDKSYNSLQIIWQRSKYFNPNQNDLYYTYRINNTWKSDTLTTIGNNVFPVFSNDGHTLFWERQSGKRWEIYCSQYIPSGYSGTFKPHFMQVIHDSTLDCKQFRGVEAPIYSFYNKQNGERSNNKGSYPLSITDFYPESGVWIQERDTSQDIGLSDVLGIKKIIQLEGSQKNPTIGAFFYGGWQVWAVWESNHTGKWGLYGSISTLVFSSVEEPKNNIGYTLYQNYPNPFNPSTVINYQLPINSFVTIKIYNILGEEITTMVNQKQPAGMHRITWEAKNMPAGVYFYRLLTEKYSEVRKMVLIK